MNHTYAPTKRPKRPPDWKAPLTDHEAWADEIVYGPRIDWGQVWAVVACGSICAALALALYVAWA